MEAMPIIFRSSSSTGTCAARTACARRAPGPGPGPALHDPARPEVRGAVAELAGVGRDATTMPSRLASSATCDDPDSGPHRFGDRGQAGPDARLGVGKQGADRRDRGAGIRPRTSARRPSTRSKVCGGLRQRNATHCHQDGQHDQQLQQQVLPREGQCSSSSHVLLSSCASGMTVGLVSPRSVPARAAHRHRSPDRRLNLPAVARTEVRTWAAKREHNEHNFLCVHKSDASRPALSIGTPVSPADIL